jgi:hypothetical protein
MNKIKKYLWLYASLLLFFNACKESDRFHLSADDNDPPDSPTNVRGVALNGAVRIYYNIPKNEDLMSIEAKCGSNVFSASFYVDSIDVKGLYELKEYAIEVYAVDKAGNKSKPETVRITPLESTIAKIAKTFSVLPGFGGFVIQWKNETEEAANIFVEYEFMQNGVKREVMTVFTSNDTAGYAIIENLILNENEQVKVKVSAGDRFNNRTTAVDKGSFTLLYDEEIIHFDENGKNLWSHLPEWEEKGGVVQAWGNEADGRTVAFIDGIIDDRPNEYNYTFISKDAGNNIPWNYIIDLGDYYELSRIILHARHGGEVGARGQYFTNDDIGIFAAYCWDEDLDEWIETGVYKNLLPDGMLSELQWYRLGRAGHMHYLYPYDPKFTKPTRWFRFEARHSFKDNYTADPPPCTSELRLFSKPKNK